MGLSDATKRVADHARSLVQLEVQLALAELKKKAIALGAGIGLTLTAAMVGFFAVAFLLAAAAAGLMTVLSPWEALLVVGGALILMAGVLALIGVTFLKQGAKPIPEQALEEAQMTRETLQDGQGT